MTRETDRRCLRAFYLRALSFSLLSERPTPDELIVLRRSLESLTGDALRLCDVEVFRAVREILEDGATANRCKELHDSIHACHARLGGFGASSVNLAERAEQAGKAVPWYAKGSMA